MRYLKQSVLRHFDPELGDILKEYGGYLAGGCFTSIATNNPINDYDIYFKSKEGLLEAVEYCQDEGYFISFISDKSVSLMHGKHHHPNGDLILIQFIYYNFYESAWDIFDEFDYTINMCAYDFQREEIMYDKDFLLHNSQRFLKFNPGTSFPILSALRVKKYEDRGYKISRREYLKIMMAISSLSIDSWEDLYKHIGGLYGMTYARKEKIIQTIPYSLEAALDVLEGIDFNSDGKEGEKWEWGLLTRILSGEEILYTSYGEGSETRAIQVFEKEEGGYSLGKEVSLLGNLKHIPLEDVLGRFLYKYVTDDLRSKSWDYQYVMGEWNEADGPGSPGRGSPNSNGTFYMNKNQKEPRWSYHGNTVLKCEWFPEDIVEICPSFIRIKKVKPVYALQEVR